MRPRRARSGRPAGLLAAVLGLCVLLAACGGEDAFEEDANGGAATPEGGGEPIIVGGADFTESLLMIEMYRALLEDAGYTTQVQTAANREIYAPALESGAIHVVPDYAATTAEFFNLDENGPDAEPVASADVEATVEALRGLAEPRGIEVLEPAEAANQNAFAVTEEFATENQLETLTDLGQAGAPVVLAATEECPDRPFCQPGLEETYGIEVSEILPLGFGSPQTKQAVVGGEARLGLVGTTDGTLEGLGLVVLEDDQGLQNADNLVPLVNAESPAGTEEVAAVLNSLSDVLTTEDLADLNLQVDQERQLPEDAARTFLEEAGLIDG